MAYIGKDLNNLGDVQTLDNITFNAGAGPYNLQKGGVQVTDADTDSVTFGADISSHIIPDVDSTYDLGTDAKRFRNF